MSSANSQVSQQSGVSYPLPPWKLQGQLYGSIWALPAGKLNLEELTKELPPLFKPVINLGRAGVFAGFVDYQPGSTLVYHELIGGIVIQVKGRWPYFFTMTHMWVDSEVSKQGGRSEWGVPKELGQFQYNYTGNNRNFQGTAQDSQGNLLAEGDFRGLVGLPRRVHLPVPFPDVQMLHNLPYRSSGTFWSSLEICRGGMNIPAQSPLASLGIVGRKPSISFGGLNFRMHLKAARPL